MDARSKYNALKEQLHLKYEMHMVFPSDFSLGGLASVGAAIITNPLEVIKTRLQLQGELAKRGTYKEPYRGIFNACVTITQNEGIRGLQKGLIPSVCFQFLMNSARLGIYSTALTNGWSQKKNGEVSFSLGVFWGATGGAAGAFLSSPFFLIKTQLQAQANQTIAVGYQHTHSGVINAFRNVLNNGGIFALWNGCWAAMVRTSIGSGSQIGTFVVTKEGFQKYNLITQSSMNSFVSSLIAGSVSAVVITPPDVITTRLYNQPRDTNGRGLIYNSLLDCFKKMLRTEGFHGFYKGFWANYIRRAPHTTLVLFFFDQLVAMRDKFYRN